MRRSPHPHYARKVAAVVVVLVCAFWLQGLARNDNLAWGTVGDYFFDHSILEGLERTVIITVVSIVIAVVLGAVLANMRLSPNAVLRGRPAPTCGSSARCRCWSCSSWSTTSR